MKRESREDSILFLSNLTVAFFLSHYFKTTQRNTSTAAKISEKYTSTN